MRSLWLALACSLAACGSSGVIRRGTTGAVAAANGQGGSGGSIGGSGTFGVAGSVGIGSATSSGSHTSGHSAASTSGAAGSTLGSSTSGSAASSSAAATTSGAVSATTSGAAGTTGSFAIAPHAPFPQIPNNGGGVLANPELVTISFQGESYDLSGFADWIVQSDWLQAVGKDYGVGLGSHIADYVSDGGVGATIDDSAIEAFLSANIGGALPSPDGNTIYVLVFPPGTSISASIGTSCENFLGYHSSFGASQGNVVYAVIPTCSNAESANAPFSFSVVTSHEIMEAATDPGGGSWALNGGVWSILGAEIGDLCQGKYFLSDAGYLAQRLWSNTAAAAGDTSPCIPLPPGETYFNVTAVSDGGGSTGDFSYDTPSSSGAQVVPFILTPWSTAPEAFAFNLAQLSGPAVSVSIKTANGQPPTLENGVPLLMNLTLPAGTSSTEINFVLLSSDDDFATQNIAPLSIHVD